jgi:hypothetical protein
MRGKWGKWSDLQLVNILVSLDTKRIVIYSEVIQLFEIIQYQGQKKMIRIVYSLPARIITEMIVPFHNNQETAG